MPDGMDGAAVLDAVETTVNEQISTEESTQSTEQDSTQKQAQERQDNRRVPDALRKHIADLRAQADAITDPAAKKAALDRIKLLYDTTGKARGYEEQFPTVREAREVKALLDAIGGREGFQQMQATLADVEQVDKQLAAGDPAVANRIWDEAPEGAPKIIPALADRFEREKPQEYAQFIGPRSVKFLDSEGFPVAFDAMWRAYEEGKTEQAQQIRDQLIQWVVQNRQQAQQQRQVDPEVERLRQENERLRQGDEAKQVETAYNAVTDHAGPVIDRVLKPLVAKLGLSAEQYAGLRNDVWNHLQETRNADPTYKTVGPAKQRQGYDAWTEYAKRWTDDNAEASARARVKFWYGHQLQNGARTQQQTVTRAPGSPQVIQGKEPMPSEIDYSVKGKQAAQKAGFKSLEDMILSGQAPLKAGGIRKWR